MNLLLLIYMLFQFGNKLTCILQDKDWGSVLTLVIVILHYHSAIGDRVSKPSVPV